MCVPWKSRGGAGVGTPSAVVPLRAIRVGVAGSRTALVGRAIAWIRTHHDEPVRVDNLAGKAGLSVSSLNRHFRASASQFSREYRRLSGVPPGRDGAQLRNASRTPD
jgi:AraC-like DNA-binding protein